MFVSKTIVKLNSTTSTQDYDITNNTGNNLTLPSGTVFVGGEISQEQTNVTSTSDVSWAVPGSDGYTDATGRRSDGTHFNESGLGQVQTNLYSNISSILGKSPILPSSPARIQLSQLGTQYHTVSTASYAHYQWFRGVNPSSPFNQTSLDEGNNWTSGIAPDIGYFGYVKDASGRVNIVVPRVVLAFISGARLALKEEKENEPVAYPNPLLDGKELHVQFNLQHSSPVRIQLVTEKGEILDQINQKMVSKGAHTYTFSLKKLKRNEELSLVIYKLVTNEHDENKNILLIK